MRSLLLLVVMSSGVSLAQPGPNAAERRDDKRDLRQDRRQLNDDRQDRGRIVRLSAEFDDAAARGDVGRMALLERDIQAWLSAEVRESQRETAQKQGEVREGRREVRSDNREVARPGTPRDDRRDRRDDRRDLADDRRDVAVERAGLARQVEIQRELSGLGVSFDPGAVARRRALHAELVAQAGREVRGDQVERSEDKRELREDRRETREDRRR